MNYEWDENKLTLNLKNHKVYFVMAEWFEWESALIETDQRKDYGEPLFRSYDVIDDRPYCLVFTPRGGDIRISACAKPIEERLRLCLEN